MPPGRRVTTTKGSRVSKDKDNKPWERIGVSREEWEVAQQVLPKPGEPSYREILKQWDEEDKRNGK